MGSDNNSKLESKIRFLKQQLSALGYEYEFTVDCLPLLENLVADLIQTSDTLKHYKELSQGCLQACHDLETFVDAYKKDNSWLVQELNAFHLNAVSEKIAYEERISDLESNIKSSLKKNADLPVSRNHSRFCQKIIEGKGDVSRIGCKNLKEKCIQYENIIKNKDIEIKHLYSEVLRLNTLLSEGRPIDTIFKDISQNYSSNDLFCIQQKNNELQQCLNEAIIDQHEAKHNALKLAEYYDQCQHDNKTRLDKFQDSKKKTDTSQEKLKQIEEEMINLKEKYQTLEAETKNAKRIDAEFQQSKLYNEISALKETCNKLENENASLQKELNESKSIHENIKSINLRLDKELIEFKRSLQENNAEKCENEKMLKKYLDEKKYLSNRIQELSIIERDLTLEITRLCNINAIHKRHILELENKLLDVYQNKTKENLPATFDLKITKKPLEKKNLRPYNCRTSKTMTNKENENYGNGTFNEKISQAKSLNILSQIREKYNKQIDNIQVDHRFKSTNIVENNLDLKSLNLKPEVTSFIDEIKILNNKVDNLKNTLLEKEKLVSNLMVKNEELLKEMKTQEKLHECEHCKLDEKMVSEYKGKLVALETEKILLMNKVSDYQRTIDCDKQHIMQLRTELHGIQMELQQHKTESNTFAKMEEKTNLSVEVSRGLQKQLEIQLESTSKQLRLMEEETRNLKHELLHLNDANTKLQKKILEIESQKHDSLMSTEEKMKKISSLENLIKVKDSKITDLEHIIEDVKKQTRKLQKELNSLTQDYLTCKTELEKTEKKAQDLNIQVHDYIAKVRAAEETLQKKDKERSEMLEHFRTLTVEATQLGNNNLTLENEARSTKNILKVAESKIADLEHTNQNKDALITGYLEQIDILTKNVAKLETQIHNLTDQRDRIQAELDSHELLCNKNDKEDDIMKSSSRKVEEELYRLQTENERLQNYLSKEKMNVSTLENILSQTRNERGHFSVTELQDEIRGLKANIKCLKEALESTNRQLRHTQSEASEYQRQIINLNRELRNLQFENIRNTADHSISYSTL